MTKIINNDQQSYGSILENQNKGSIFKSDYTPFSKAKKVSSKDDINNPNRFKLGTFSGCFIPTILNIISILMFLRFGHIISLLGVSGTFVILIISYLIDVLTTLSISAIATNGIVPGGGVYVIICRSLGIEFGGGIGIVFFLGQVLNSGMNCVGMFEPINNNFGPMLNNTLSDNNGFWLNSIILFFSFVICLIGSDIVSKLGNVLAVVLTSAIISIPITTFFKGPAYSNDALIFTGLSWNTFYMNFWPDWELLHLNKTETINSLFGLFFCATAGIFSGAGMSSELRKPSKSIPKGTLYGLFVTFISYAVVILSLSSSIPRNVMYKDYQIIQSTSVFPMLIVLGEISTSLFSIIVGLIGSGYVLDAISKDEILPGLKKIKLHTKKNLSLLIAYALTQLCLFSDVNKIANFVTMSFLLTFIVTNLACFLLEVSAAPNFRPSFKYFNRYTCLLGGILSIAAMFVVDGQQALTIMLLLLVLMLIIHYTVPPKFFGDVSQNLIYHQVRKYLLKIKINDNIKYWRPQILLLINDPNHEKNWRLMNFCNDLKKSGLYILGHILIQDNLEDEEEKIFKEYEKEVYRWEKIRDMAKLKAFIHVSIANSVQWGIRNLYLGSGLGGMKPNITILGLYGEGNTIRKELSLNMDPDSPTLDSQKWVRIVEDLSLMKSNIAIAKGFDSINIPDKADKPTEKKYIDLYPIQMSNNKKKFNFDTCTLIMQLGALLKTVPKWHKTHKLRCITFVEFEYERSDEYKKLNELLSILRIECDIIILCLQDFGVYNTILKGDSNNKRLIDVILKDDPWWQELKNVRNNLHIQYRRHSLAPSSAKIDVNLHQSYKKLRHLSKYGVSLGNKVPGDEDSDDDEDTSISSEASNIKEYVQKKLKADSDISSNKDMVNPVFSSDQLPKTQIFETPFSSQPTLGFVDEENRLGSSVMTKKGSLMLQPTMSPKQNSNYTEYLNGLSFNNLPRNVQFLILNDIFLSVSPDHITNLILTTLPLPIENTFKNKVLSEKYVEDLNIWLMDSQKDIHVKMPAALLINSQTMTVTTAL